MGFGNIAGTLFFLMVLFAALTSAISLAETGVSTFEDQLGWSRRSCSLLMGVIMLALGSASALGFSVLSFVTILGMSILDFFDFLSNSIMMPLAALSTCILIIRVVGFRAIAEEVERSSAFRRKKMYNFFLKYLAPICMGWITL